MKFTAATITFAAMTTLVSAAPVPVTEKRVDTDDALARNWVKRVDTDDAFARTWVKRVDTDDAFARTWVKRIDTDTTFERI